MKISKNKIEELIAPIVQAMGYYVWHIDLHQAKRGSSLRIYIDVLPDNERKGVSIDDCGKISKQVGALLEVEDIILGDYVLEVSSPGIDRSLFKLEHYQKYIGSTIRISLFKPVDKRRDFTGKLQDVVDNKIQLLVDDEAIDFELIDICKAKLISDF